MNFLHKLILLNEVKNFENPAKGLCVVTYMEPFYICRLLFSALVYMHKICRVFAFLGILRLNYYMFVIMLCIGGAL